MKKFILIPLVLALVGCGTARVIDVDPAKYEAARLKKIGKTLKEEKTPDYVVVADKERIKVETSKTVPTREEKVDLETWNVSAHNSNDVGKCVTVKWKLMDFRLVTEQPSEFYVPPYSSTKIGQMIQDTWIIDDVRIAPPGSGFVENMRVRKTIPNARLGEECMYIEEGKDY